MIRYYCDKCNAQLTADQNEHSLIATCKAAALCDNCLEQFKTDIYCQICGRAITYEQYLLARGQYCKICNEVLS